MSGFVRLGDALARLLGPPAPGPAKSPDNPDPPTRAPAGPPDRLASHQRSHHGSAPARLPFARPLATGTAPMPAIGRSVAPGVWFGTAGHTRDGAPVRVVTIDPRQARLAAVFADGVRNVGPSAVRRLPGLVAAVNGTFFGERNVGDLRGLGRTYLDEAGSSGRARASDQASDRRHYLAVTHRGDVLTGTGGLAETGRALEIDAFQGGLGLLFERHQAATLERDIASGAFAGRIFFGRAAQSETVARTFAGVRADGTVLLVTMGEGSKRSQGADFVEAARHLRALGAEEAFFLDGGGSTSMLVPGVAETRTDGRQVKGYLAVFRR